MVWTSLHVSLGFSVGALITQKMLEKSMRFIFHFMEIGFMVNL